VNGAPVQPGDRSLPPETAAALEEGLRRFQAGDREGAHEAFGQAYRRNPSDPRVQSWYGLTLVLVEKNSNLGVVLVDGAVRNGRPEPELVINQSRVAMALGQRVRAVRALERGLAFHPGDPDLVAARIGLGTRQRPVVPFLSRRNWLNRMLGRIHHGWTERRPASEAPPRVDGEG
jgi:tetratricopeptide (TPR) repeat protein